MSGGVRQRDNLTPSLFPFLAVLLCTMGSLVLILMLIVSGAQSDAQEAKQLAKESREERQGLAKHANGFFREELSELTLELEKERLVLQHYEEHILELTDKLDSLNSQLADGVSNEGETAQSLTDKQELVQRELSKLEKQLAEAKQELEKTPEKTEGDKPIFAVIPYAGPNGTHRRPIYVECSEDGITLQPEGNRLSLSDLEPPHGPGNPLDAALRAIRSEYRPETEALTTTAYPLLLVRPSGIRAYALARSAMSGWDDQFGYELIDEDMELAFPKGTPGLRNKVARAIQLAQERQSALAMAMPQKYGQQTPRPLGAQRARGSTVGRGRPSSKISFFESPPNSLADNSQETGSSRGNANTNSGAGNSPSRGGFTAGTDRESFADAEGSYFGNPGANTPDSEASNRYVGQNGTGSGAYGFARGGEEQTSVDAMMRAGSSGGQTQSMEFFPPGSGSYELSDSASNARSSYSSNAETNSGFGDPNALFTSNESGSPANGSASAGGPSASSQSESQSAQGGGSNQTRQPSGASSAGSGQTTANQMAEQMGGGGGSGASPSRGGSQMTGTQNSSSPQNDTPDSQDSQPGMPSLNMTMSNQQPESTTPVAESRGRNWAYQPRSRQRTTVVRNIHLHCFSDRWVVLPDDGNPSRALTIPFDDTPEERAQRLAKTIRERVDNWGLALAGGTWKPVLVVDVAPQADWRFDQLERLLRGSGLDVEKRSRAANVRSREMQR